MVETLVHIARVRDMLNCVIVMLLHRGEEHDASKLEEPELSIFANAKPLKSMTYGSPEYDESLKQVEVALAHHYAHNRHHPQHFEDGINDMNLIDLIEMIVDWKASGERHPDGNLLKSISINQKRFGMGEQLTRIFNNTARLFDDL